MEVVQHEGAEQQRPPGPESAPPRFSVRPLGDQQQQQQRQKEGRDLLQEPAQPGRTPAAHLRRIAAVRRVAPRLLQQIGHAPDQQSPAQVGNTGVQALHRPAAARLGSARLQTGNTPRRGYMERQRE